MYVSGYVFICRTARVYICLVFANIDAALASALKRTCAHTCTYAQVYMWSSSHMPFTQKCVYVHKWLCGRKPSSSHKYTGFRMSNIQDAEDNKAMSCQD